jgi:hypothetical protein
MKRIILRTSVSIVVLALCAGIAVAQSATEKEITQLILDNNEYTKKNLKDVADSASKAGSLEFWSSGGLLQQVPPGGGPVRDFDAMSLDAKHIQVITLVEGQAAVAQYYSEGSMKPKGSPAVPHYLTRVTEVYVKEGGKWKVRAAHWSAVTGGSGTSQTSLDQ